VKVISILDGEPPRALQLFTVGPLRCSSGWWQFEVHAVGGTESEWLDFKTLTRLRTATDGALIAHSSSDTVSGIIFKERSHAEEWTRFDRYQRSSPGER